MKKIKHIFCDMDGTLYGKDLKISKNVVNAINNLTDISFSISTARGVDEAFGLITELYLTAPQIVENGATIVNPDKSIIQQHFLSQKTVEEIISFFASFEVWKKVCIDGALVDFERAVNLSQVTKISLQDLTEDMWVKIDNELSKYSDIYYSKSKAAHKPGFLSLDISCLKSTKQEAVFKVMQILKLKKDEIMGIGDSYNDYPLLMACGTKVAMGNAVDELKAIADIVAPSVYEDGVADVINKLK